MKLLTCFLIVFGFATANAEVTVRVTKSGLRKTEGSPLHVFRGRAVEFSVEVAGSKDDPAHDVPICASLYQVAGTIAAPLARDIPIEVVNGQAVFKVDLSSFQNVTAVELRFTVQKAGETSPRIAGESRVVVYPDDLLAQTKKLLHTANEKQEFRLAVLGDSPHLKAILRGAAIEFEEMDGFRAYARGSHLLFLCEAESARARDLIGRAPRGSALLLFTEDLMLPAGVYWTQHGEGFAARITIPILLDFDQAPERQQLLLTLIQHALKISSTLP